MIERKLDGHDAGELILPVRERFFIVTSALRLGKDLVAAILRSEPDAAVRRGQVAQKDRERISVENEMVDSEDKEVFVLVDTNQTGAERRVTLQIEGERLISEIQRHRRRRHPFLNEYAIVITKPRAQNRMAPHHFRERVREAFLMQLAPQTKNRVQMMKRIFRIETIEDTDALLSEGEWNAILRHGDER